MWFKIEKRGVFVPIKSNKTQLELFLLSCNGKDSTILYLNKIFQVRAFFENRLLFEAKSYTCVMAYTCLSGALAGCVKMMYHMHFLFIMICFWPFIYKIMGFQPYLIFFWLFMFNNIDFKKNFNKYEIKIEKKYEIFNFSSWLLFQPLKDNFCSFLSTKINEDI